MNIEKTQLKLAVSKRSGILVGFVYRHVKTRKLLGVREDAPCGKQICLLSDDISLNDVQPNKLYEASLKAMHNGNGYVIVALKPIEFPAQIEIKVIPQTQYQVTLTFGNKVVYYDPIKGRTPSSRTPSGVIALLMEREDILNKSQAIEDFLEHVKILESIMENDNIRPPARQG